MINVLTLILNIFFNEHASDRYFFKTGYKEPLEAN